LFTTIIHENGRLTLLGSLFFFDHFLACLPMIILFALIISGAFALGNHIPAVDAGRLKFISLLLLSASVIFILVTFMLSIYTVGWQGTVAYGLQRVERDGVMTPGGNWNQLQLSNVPIGLLAIGVSTALSPCQPSSGPTTNITFINGGITCIGMAMILCLGITAFNWPGWKCFINPRWLAHSIREIATYPLTAIPIALASILWVESYISGCQILIIQPRLLSMTLIGISGVLTIAELSLLLNVDIFSMAQKPAFAPSGLSIPYLLFSHVFEHFLDFLLIGPLTGGVYAMIRWLSL